jgi:hypothetical protein
MKKILLFEDFIEDLSLSEEEQAEIRNFMNKYSKYSEFHDDAQFEDSVDDIVNDVMKQFSFPESKKDDVKSYITSLQDLSDGLSVIMEPNKEFIYRTQPDGVQSFIM